MRCDRQVETSCEVSVSQQFVVGKKSEYGIAFFNLALANCPKVDCSIDDALIVCRGKLCAQCQAIQFGIFEALIKLLIDHQVTGLVTGLCEVQCIPVAQVTGGAQHAVLRKKRVYIGMHGIPECAAKPCGAQVGPENVAGKQLSVVDRELVDYTPIA